MRIQMAPAVLAAGAAADVDDVADMTGVCVVAAAATGSSSESSLTTSTSSSSSSSILTLLVSASVELAESGRCASGSPSDSPVPGASLLRRSSTTPNRLATSKRRLRE